MSFFKASTDKKDLQQGGDSAYLTKSGCYPVNLIAPFVSVSKGGSTSIDLFLDHKDQKQVVYGNLRITNNDGGSNEIGMKVFNQLVIIAGVEEVSDPVDAELPIGKDGKDVDVSVLEDLSEIDVIVRIQMEYGVYNGSITEKKIIKGFYRAEDNASAEEIVNGSEAGKQYEKDSKYFENVTYKDGLDEQAVKDWIAAQRPKGTAPAGGSSSSAPAKKASFGQKRTFGKK